MQKMRGDRGLNYGDYAYAEHFAQDGWTRFPAPNVARRAQYFSIWVRPVPVDKAHFATRMAIRELEAFVREGLSQADFERIQAFASRYYALFAQTEQQRLGNRLDELFYGLNGPYLETLCGQLQRLTRDEVNAAIKRHIDPRRLQIAIVAPNAAALAAVLASDAASPITYDSEKPAEVLEEDKLIAVHPVGLSREHIQIVEVSQIFR
jgi:zinc protease